MEGKRGSEVEGHGGAGVVDGDRGPKVVRANACSYGGGMVERRLWCGAVVCWRKGSAV